MSLSALPNITEAPNTGAQNRLYVAIITSPDSIPHSGVPTCSATPPSGVSTKSLLGGNYAPLGCTKTLKLKAPSAKMHAIACGLEPARWQTPGMRQLGTLDVTTLDFAGQSNDILQYINQRCVAAIVTEDFSGNDVRAVYCVDWMPQIDIDVPEGEGEVSVTANGEFSRMVIDRGLNGIDADLG